MGSYGQLWNGLWTIMEWTVSGLWIEGISAITATVTRWVRGLFGITIAHGHGGTVLGLDRTDAVCSPERNNRSKLGSSSIVRYPDRAIWLIIVFHSI